MLDLHGGLFWLLFEVLQQHHELVAAKARHCVTYPHCAVESCSSQTQDFVTNMMPMQIVDVLKSVEVEKHQRCAFSATHATIQHMLQAIEEKAPIGQVG
ncbi:hypothetical protein D3C80_854110 [compost metagenome]